MKNRTKRHTMVFALAVALASSLLFAANENEDLEALRNAFDARFNKLLDEHAQEARQLRDSYIGALERLKTDLGKAGRLEEAAQVLAELETVKNGEEPIAVPPNAAFKLKQLRSKWDRELTSILDAKDAAIRKLAQSYERVLNTRKDALTRAGKIEEALAYKDELARMKAMPEILAAEGQPETDEIEEPVVDAAEIMKMLEGTSWTWETERGKGTVTFLTRRKAKFSWTKELAVVRKSRSGGIEIEGANWRKRDLEPFVLTVDFEEGSLEGRRDGKLGLRGKRIGK